MRRDAVMAPASRFAARQGVEHVSQVSANQSRLDTLPDSKRSVMSTTLPALDTRNLGSLDRDVDIPSAERAVLSSYDGSNVVSRLLRMETWGPAR